MRAFNEWLAKRPLVWGAIVYAFMFGLFWTAKAITGKWPSGDVTHTLVWCFAFAASAGIGAHTWGKLNLGRNPS